MFQWLRASVEKLTGTRRFAAGAVAFYIVGWLAERALTLFWEKILEKQAPDALRQVSDMLATDLATGMALMALLVLFVPPVAQWVFEGSAALTRYLELRSRRLSRRDYLAGIADEAITIAQTARGITVQGRWDYDDPAFADLPRDEAWRARDRRRMERDQEKGQALQNFVANHLGRANFLMREFVHYGYAREVPHVFEHITNYFCLGELAHALEEAAYKAQTALVRDGYPVKKDQGARPQSPPGIEVKTPQ